MEKTGNLLGAYLRDRRSKIVPASLGFATGRRRAPGLRREEVAQRANISPTWYTWLEQGRGGAPSADTLDRVAAALMLTEVEREHLFLLAFGRPPAVKYNPIEAISPRLQRMLDAMDNLPAIVRTPTWDIVAWNRAATVILTDYGELPPRERNLLRLLFKSSQAAERSLDWEEIAAYVVAVFRADVARTGAGEFVQPLIDELRHNSPEFERMWNDNQVRTHGDSVKRLHHPIMGTIALEMSAFGIDNRSDLELIVYNPARGVDGEKIRALLRS